MKHDKYTDVYNCDIYTEIKNLNEQIVFLKVIYNPEADLSVPIKHHDSLKHFFIENDYEELKFIR
eukprot:CAMPEP_0170553800 /NCGR_PEP_ID=MMETSP0211-20121228/11613_1 /TAXON_ID=311385 /ORGANISM="Pseudokeronopsis sp., Strain OXSARD2" /LENGTH=64 /DNA_ID=CAMNT_0010862357 /DNA_START=861 /DNA_END=1055 /DNA_ORIENTATION=+